MTPSPRSVLVLCLLVSITPVSAALLYEDPHIPIGTFPITVCRADFNEDGHLDVATANLGSSDLSVLLGDGHGDFLPEKRVQGEVGPFWLACGDVTGDGHADLVFTEYDGSVPQGVDIIPGNGAGEFGASAHIPGTFYSLLIADVNGDQRGDIVLADGFGLLTVLPSQPGGGLGPQITTAVSQGPWALGAADLNGDGHLDIAGTLIGLPYGVVSILLGDGTGHFTEAPPVDTGGDPEWVEFGDLDEDGHADMVVMETYDSTISTHRGRGDGTFEPRQTLPAADSSYVVQIADVDGDGHQDLISTSGPFPAPRLEVLKGSGTGAFTPAFSREMEPAYSGVAGDFNHDGRADFALAGFNGALRLLEGRSDAGLGPQILPLPPPAHPGDATVVPGIVATGDVNGDGREDIVLPVRGQFPGRVGGVATYLGSADGHFTVGPFLEVVSNPIRVALADLDGDGDLDLVTSNEGYPSGRPPTQQIFPPDVRTFLGAGNGSFMLASTFASFAGGGTLTLLHDDADGRIDLFYHGGMYHGLGDGTFQNVWQLSLLPGDFLRFDDLNGDGIGDLVTHNRFEPSGPLGVSFGQGGGLFASPVRYAAPSILGGFAFGDADADGVLDLLLSEGFMGPNPDPLPRVSLIQGLAGGAFAPPHVFMQYTSSPVMAIRDLDGDGDGELTLQRTSSAGPGLLIFENDGGLSFHPRQAVAAPSPFLPLDHQFADLNDDGLPDLLFTSGAGVAVHLNRLSRGNHPPTAVAAAVAQTECTSPAGADVLLDGTGSSDQDSTAGTQDDIASYEWFEVVSGTPMPLGTGATLTVTLPLGPHALLLRVVDQAGDEGMDPFDVRVVDTVAPSITVHPGMLWPPNHRLVPITITATDLCGGTQARFVAAASSEPDDAPGGWDGNTTQDVVLDTGGRLELRAERDARGAGRTYTLDAVAVDGSGNQAAASTVIPVPHDRGGSTDPLSLTVSQAPSGTLVSWAWRGFRDLGDVAFDVVSGEIGAVRSGPHEVDLGDLRCVEGSSRAMSTAGREDARVPGPNRAFFYLVQYRDTGTGAASSYGEERAEKPRLASGGCP
jgi:hypothetical protein